MTHLVSEFSFGSYPVGKQILLSLKKNLLLVIKTLNILLGGLGTNKVAQHLVLHNKQTDFLILVSFTIHLAQKWHQILKFFNVFMTIIILNALFQGKISFEIFIILHIQPWQKELINLNVSKEKKFCHYFKIRCM